MSYTDISYHIEEADLTKNLIKIPKNEPMAFSLSNSISETVIYDLVKEYVSFYSLPVVMPEIYKVIFNDPATIVFWTDGTKTVVKCGEGDIFDPEKGLAMAISKKALGNQGNYFETFKKWIEGCSEKEF